MGLIAEFFGRRKIERDYDYYNPSTDEKKILSSVLYVFVSHNLNNEHILNDDEFTLGRAKDFNFNSNEKWTRYRKGKIEIGTAGPLTSTISRNHIKFKKQNDGRYSVEDTGSKYGTFINGKPLIPGEEIILEDKDKINIGHGKYASPIMFQIKYVFS